LTLIYLFSVIVTCDCACACLWIETDFFFPPEKPKVAWVVQVPNFMESEYYVQYRMDWKPPVGPPSCYGS